MLEVKAIDRDIWKEAGSQGLFGLDIPEEFGGMGADDYRFNAVAAEVINGFNAAVGSCFGIHSDVCPPYIVDLGTQEQKERWLPAMAAGEKICAIAMTEPGGGSDLAALKTTAVRDGDAWVLNGSKTFITNGYQADLVIVATRTDPSKGAKGITLFMVEDGMEGFTRGRKLDKVGQEESDTAELFFQDVRVPDSNRIGDEGMGFIAMMQRLPAGAGRGGLRQRRPRQADPARDHRVRQGAQGVRPVDRVLPAQQVQARRAGHLDRGRRGLRRRLHRGARRGHSCPRSTPPRPSGGAPRCRTTCSTSACSCTAATAS